MGRHPQLHAQLRDTGVWRRLVAPRDGSLYDLHRMLQMAMGWEDCHLHAFRRGRQRIAVHPGEDPFEQPPPPGSDVVPLAEHLSRKGARLSYEYDYGDSWVIDLRVEALVDEPEEGRWLLGGELAGPPEDCGGVWGYQELCEAFGAEADLDDEDLEELRERHGDWTPDRFDPEEVMFGPSLSEVVSFERWAGADRAMPYYLRDEEDDERAVRLRASLWVDVDSGMVLTAELNTPLSEALEVAIERAGGAPKRVVVDDEETSHRLRFARRELDVQRGTAEALDEAWESLLDSMGDVGFEPRFVEPDGSPREVERFFEAMTAVHRAAPWRSLSETVYLRIHVAALDVDVVVSVIGSAGVSEGVVVYESVQTAERFVRLTHSLGGRPGQRAAGGRVLNLTYGRRADLAPAMRRELKEHRWRHPRGKVPFVIALDENGVVAPVHDDDYRLAVLAAHAACEATERAEQLSSGALSFRTAVELPGHGSVELEVSHPVPALEAMEHELDEAWAGALAYDPEIAPDAEAWLAADESERMNAALQAHAGVDTGESPQMHAVIHAIVETQLALGDPPEVMEGLVDLLASGRSRHDAIHALGAEVATELFELLSQSPDAAPPRKRRPKKKRRAKKKRKRR